MSHGVWRRVPRIVLPGHLALLRQPCTRKQKVYKKRSEATKWHYLSNYREDATLAFVLPALGLAAYGYYNRGSPEPMAYQSRMASTTRRYYRPYGRFRPSNWRRGRRTTRRSRRTQRTPNQVSTFFRYTYTFNLPSGQFKGDAKTFKVNEANGPEVEAYQRLYDSYRISKIRLDFLPRGNIIDQSSPTSEIKSFVYYVAADVTDATAPTSLNEILEYAHCSWARGTDPMSMTLRPKVAGAIYSGTTTPGFIALNGFVDSARIDIPHFGLKWAAQIGGPTGQDVYVDVVVTMSVTWKGRR